MLITSPGGTENSRDCQALTDFINACASGELPALQKVFCGGRLTALSKNDDAIRPKAVVCSFDASSQASSLAAPLQTFLLPCSHQLGGGNEGSG